MVNVPIKNMLNLANYREKLDATFVVEYSPSQKAFNVISVLDMLQQNREIAHGREVFGGYVPVAFVNTPEEATAAINDLRKEGL